MNPFYRSRVNAVMDYIDGHLGDKLSLEILADVSCFSKYHFHRVFKSVTGETLNGYIRRQRLEQAARMIRMGTTGTLTDLALDLGYSSGANFSRDFREYYGLSPSRAGRESFHPLKPDPEERDLPEVPFREIRRLDDMRLLYVRIDTGYDSSVIGPAFQSLYDFALPRGLAGPGAQSVGIGYDDPDYTPAGKCRYDACLQVDDRFLLEPDSSFNLKTLESGMYALFPFEGRGEQFDAAWESVFSNWLINGSWIPDNRPHLELYYPSERYREGIFRVDLCLPVRNI